MHFATMLLGVIAEVSSQNVCAAPIEVQAPAGTRIDIPVTPSNSVKVNFGGGTILRVPKVLLPEDALPEGGLQSISIDKISFSFQYPDMVRSNYEGPMGEVVVKDDGHWGWSLPKVGRFPVNIVHLFHSVEDVSSVEAKNATRGIDWRPIDRLHFVENAVRDDGREHDFRGLPDAKIALVDSKYKGLREIKVPITDREYYERSRQAWRDSGWNGVEGAQYVARIGSPYELYMICEAPSSIKCEADVFLKSNHFQYKMIFPPDEVAHADELIRAINKMIEGWGKGKLH